MNTKDDQKETNPASDDTKFQRAWEYHQNADSIQHQRHAIFLLAQTIFFAGFGGSTESSFRWLVVLLGFVVAILWLRVATLLERRLDKMRKILDGEPIWRCYADAAPQKAWSGSRWIMNGWLPGLTLVAWLWLALFLIFQAQSGPTSASQPNRSETNQASSEVVSRR